MSSAIPLSILTQKAIAQPLQSNQIHGSEGALPDTSRSAIAYCAFMKINVNYIIKYTKGQG
jgi:hypothetical protein